MEVLEKTKRRWRNRPQPTGRHVEATRRVVEGVLKPLYEHGQLATPYLLPFVQRITPETSLNSLAKFLEVLYHEDNTDHGGRYVRRVAEHPDMPDFTRYAIYDVTPFAEQALEESGYKPAKRSFSLDFDPHRFMISCTGASLEIAATENPKLKWESRASILSEAPGKILRIPCTISHNGYTSHYGLLSDDLFGLEYEGKYWRLLSVECDRGNEPYERANLDETSLHAKFLRYKQVIEGGLYKAHYGRRCGMLALFVFNTTSKMDGFLKRVQEWNGGPCPWICAKTIPCFGKNLSIPPVMRDLLITPWKRAGFPDIDISRP
jgi:hypothetical protein